MAMAKVECLNCGEKNEGQNKYCFNCGHSLPVSTEPEATIESPVARETSSGRPAAQMPYPMPPKKNKTLKIVLLVLGVMVVLWGGGYVFFRYFFMKIVAQKAKTEALHKINSQCPAMVNNSTRLDSARAVGDSALEYFYTLAVDRSTLDKEKVVPQVTTSLAAAVKSTQELAFFRQIKTTFIYTYHDEKGEVLFSIPVTPSMYQ
jgi:hypothetical protein